MKTLFKTFFVKTWFDIKNSKPKNDIVTTE